MRQLPANPFSRRRPAQALYWMSYLTTVRPVFTGATSPGFSVPTPEENIWMFVALNVSWFSAAT